MRNVPSMKLYGRPGKIVLMFFLASMLTVISGCSSNRSTLPLTSSPNNHYPVANFEGASWWTYQFKNVWPENGKPDGAIDLFLAQAVVAPVLKAHIADIPYWRFHRRAVRDASGHRFSFLFYSKPDTAYLIFAKLDESTLLKKAIAAKLVESVTKDDPDHPHSPGIEDTSDILWSLDLQRNWPSFIMGVSSLWLGLITDYMGSNPNDVEDVHALLEQYREVGDKVTATWRKEGRHALLHHLNAIFGYAPIAIPMNF